MAACVAAESPPPALGTSTVAAMQSGIFWGAVGTIRQLIDELTKGEGRFSHIFLTGGASESVFPFLRADTQHFPHLTLAGIAMVANKTTP